MKMLSLFRGNKSSNARDDIVLPDDIEPKNDEKLFDKDEDSCSCCLVIVRIGLILIIIISDGG